MRGGVTTCFLQFSDYFYGVITSKRNSPVFAGRNVHGTFLTGGLNVNRNRFHFLIIQR